MDIENLRKDITQKSTVINDCIDIIENCHDLETVIINRNNVLEEIEWFVDVKKKKLPVKTNLSPGIFKDKFLKLCDKKISEIIGNSKAKATDLTNKEYWNSDQLRWKHIDFVLGYEIKISGNNRPKCELCKNLAGIYPKNFLWLGWHEKCTCFIIPVLNSKEDFIRQIKGDKVDCKYVNSVPKGFIDWYLDSNINDILPENRPYFVNTNIDIIEQSIHNIQSNQITFETSERITNDVPFLDIMSENVVDMTNSKNGFIAKKRVVSVPTIGSQIAEYKRNMPEFNFYFDMPSGMQTDEYLTLYSNVPFDMSQGLRYYINEYKSILDEAKLAESLSEVEDAIDTYKYLIEEEYEYTEPYERLMILYKKLKFVEPEKEIISRAIDFFESLREKQKNYIIEISRKYNSEEKALEYVNRGKRIQYYGGAFDLYNPYNKIDTWKLRLHKLKK